MDYKLKAISNDIDNDTIAELMSKSASESSDKWDAKKDIASNHICQRSVPVLFTSISGVYLRKFSRSSANNYSITSCDLARWNFRRNHFESIGLTPPSTSSDKSSTIKQKPTILMVETRNNADDDDSGRGSGS